MLVTDIEISQYHYDTRSSRHLATVAMTCKNRVVSLFCQLDLPRNEPAKDRASAFVRDAIRQLRRMPEFRSGSATLEFLEPHWAASEPAA